jgi:Pyrimidine dimer DNA glycosylase
LRLWSLDPSVLDSKGLVALWREGLLAQKVLRGETKGYRFHPQLRRFRAMTKPVAAMRAYLDAVADEAQRRGYAFDRTKIAGARSRGRIAVTRGQIEFERRHLLKKLRARDPERARKLARAELKAHPMMRVVAGAVEEWEIV